MDITSIVVLAAAWPGFVFGLLPELPVTLTGASLNMGSILLVVGKVVEEMVRQETSLTNTAAESQGTCISDVHQLPFLDFTSAMLVVLNLTWRSLPVSLAAMAFLKLITSMCFFQAITVMSP